MPYADPEKQREAGARSYRNRRADPAFAEAERQRVQEWKDANREQMLAKGREYAKKRYAEQKLANEKRK